MASLLTARLMTQATADLSDDMDACHASIAAQAEHPRRREMLVEKWKAQLAVLKPGASGSRQRASFSCHGACGSDQNLRALTLARQYLGLGDILAPG
jgi:hypothetical protein